MLIGPKNLFKLVKVQIIGSSNQRVLTVFENERSERDQSGRQYYLRAR